VSNPGRVGAVILNWNQPALTVRCAAHVHAQKFPGGQDVLVVDNGPTPENAAKLKRELSAGCSLLRSETNRGFAGGMNFGCRAARRIGNEFVWLLNNDAFPEPGCLAELVAALDADPRLVGVTPTLIDANGREQPAGARLKWDPLEHEPLSTADLEKPVGRGFWISGAAFLLRRAAFENVRGFDERFFAYWEDVDLCQQLAIAGGLLRAVPTARCVHLGSASTEEGTSAFAAYMIARNAWLFLRKHVPVGRVPATGLSLLAGQLNHAGVLKMRGYEDAARAVLAGAVVGMAGRTGRPKRRRNVGAWADALLAHPWGFGKAIRAAGRLVPTRIGPRA
jgi:GT2 family glycosyltransferase